ncbi:MAG: hypothetical protein ACREXT_10050 [Gammaproteobacteria bacterium]
MDASIAKPVTPRQPARILVADDEPPTSNIHDEDKRLEACLANVRAMRERSGR